MFHVVPMVATENTYRRYTKENEKGIKVCNCKKKKKKSTKQEERQQEGKRVTKKPQDRKKTS